MSMNVRGHNPVDEIHRSLDAAINRIAFFGVGIGFGIAVVALFNAF